MIFAHNALAFGPGNGRNPKALKTASAKWAKDPEEGK
jgi:hypothetical protein